MGQALPSARRFRWPILVSLDRSGDEPTMLGLKTAVADHLHLMAGPDASPPPTESSGFIACFVQALTDLNAAGMIEADEQGLLWITEAGRRASEIEVDELPEADGVEPDDDGGFTPMDPPRATLRDYFFAALESIIG